MRQFNRIIKKLDKHISLSDAFRILEKEPYVSFLDSSLPNKLGRYSILGIKPYEVLEKKEDEFFINGVKCKGVTFEAYVKEYLKKYKDPNTSSLPIVSGAIGYFSYDYGMKKQGICSKNHDIVIIPEAVLIFYDVFLVEDLEEKETYIVANGIIENPQKSIESIRFLLSKEVLEFEDEKKNDCVALQANFEKAEYKNAVADMIQYIIEGDIYIANMTQQLTIESKKSPLQVFYDLRKQNPSPFGGYLNYGDFQIISASPERFLKMNNGHVETRPIKGTRKRGSTPEEDQELKNELIHSEKDKSELLMIVDLERNDLNRVCKAGSVQVTELFTVEEYATVFHLVSNIEGDLSDDKTVMDLIEAAFPGGSITGAPKYRAMEIIDELEHGRRNLYTGSIGYVTLDGDCDFNIVIRTAVHKNGKYYLGVGGGITAESELEFEYEETLQKARAVAKAIGYEKL